MVRCSSIALASFVVLSSVSIWGQQVVRVSVGAAGVQGDRASASAAISADGRSIAFSSDASNLVGGDTNGATDIFLRDRLQRVTTRVSLSPSGLPANGPSFSPSISADGRFVAFWSYASNLVAGDTNGVSDVFLRDVLAGTTMLLSVGTAREQANGRSLYPVVSAEGRFVAFASAATNLVPEDTNGSEDIFVRDLQSEKTTRASVDFLGMQGTRDSYGPPSISADGRRVAFASDSRLVPLDQDRLADVYVRDLQAGSTTSVSVSSAGDKGNFGGGAPSISAAGDKVVFDSASGNLVPGDSNFTGDVFLRDLARGTTTRESVTSHSEQCLGASNTSLLSPDGSFLIFSTNASNLAPHQDSSRTDVFVRDLVHGTTVLVSSSSRGVDANGLASFGNAISADGRHIVFGSDADNLAPRDTNAAWDLFVFSLTKFRR